MDRKIMLKAGDIVTDGTDVVTALKDCAAGDAVTVESFIINGEPPKVGDAISPALLPFVGQQGEPWEVLADRLVIHIRDGKIVKHNGGE